MSDYFLDPRIFFSQPNQWGIGIALVFGLFWLALLAPKQAMRPPFWVMFLVGVGVFVPAVAWVQVPLQTLSGEALTRLWTMEELQGMILLAVVPQVLIGGLVQEGAKFIPIVAWFVMVRKGIAGPRTALLIGAAVGAGFAVVEGQWMLNNVFAQGFTRETLQLGWDAYLPFSERFFITGFGVAAGAFMAWGLARGMGWQFFLIAALLHGALNYVGILYQLDKLTLNQVEVAVAVFAVAFFGLVSVLRWRTTGGAGEAPPAEGMRSPGQDTLVGALEPGGRDEESVAGRPSDGQDASGGMPAVGETNV